MVSTVALFGTLMQSLWLCACAQCLGCNVAVIWVSARHRNVKEREIRRHMLHLSPRCPGKDRCFSELGWAACSRFVERWLCALSSNGAYLVGLSWMLSCGEEFETDFDRQFQRQGAQEKRLYVKKLSKQTDSNNFLRLQHILARH